MRTPWQPGRTRTGRDFTRRVVTVNGMRVPTAISTAEPCERSAPLVLVPGLGVSYRYLLPFARVMAPHRRVYLLDLPGFGFGAGRPTHPLTVGALAELLRAWLVNLGIERAVLLGNSLSCQVIAELAARFPERVAGAVLTSPTPDPAISTPWHMFTHLVCDAPREPLLLLPLVARDWLATGPRRMLAGLFEMLRYPPEPALSAMRAPVLIVRGSRDALVSRAWAEEIRDLVPNGELAVLDGAVHAVTYDAPAPLARCVWDFLARHAAALTPADATSLMAAPAEKHEAAPRRSFHVKH